MLLDQEYSKCDLSLDRRMAALFNQASIGSAFLKRVSANQEKYSTKKSKPRKIFY